VVDVVGRVEGMAAPVQGMIESVLRKYADHWHDAPGVEQLELVVQALEVIFIEFIEVEARPSEGRLASAGAFPGILAPGYLVLQASLHVDALVPGSPVDRPEIPQPQVHPIRLHHNLDYPVDFRQGTPGRRAWGHLPYQECGLSIEGDPASLYTQGTDGPEVAAVGEWRGGKHHRGQKSDEQYYQQNRKLSPGHSAF